MCCGAHDPVISVRRQGLGLDEAEWVPLPLQTNRAQPHGPKQRPPDEQTNSKGFQLAPIDPVPYRVVLMAMVVQKCPRAPSHVPALGPFPGVARQKRTVPDRRWVMWSEIGVPWNRREPRRIWRRREIGLLFPLFVGGLADESEDGSREDFNGAGIRWVCNEWPNDDDDEKNAGCRSNCRAAEKKVSPLAGTLTIPPLVGILGNRRWCSLALACVR
ncbi:hypothetical protein CCHR01_12979 [Colletotrichum chrysophilum]|uniref:Uncharacterized protein n=1 Tax=Colletotrichum chrysophilum TaxID=1836956 RepID=A0AAD9EDL5_9PEZI|nr:hypothetical protein CCHR01_12979 [Colletotrichum chrysophilum]